MGMGRGRGRVRVVAVRTTLPAARLMATSAACTPAKIGLGWG